MSLKTVGIYVVIVGLFLTAECSNRDNNKLETISDNDLQKVEVIDETGLNKLIQERDNKILLLNFWATWCIPCRDEFPGLVKIANKYKDQNLEVIGISADYPDEIKSKIQPFLKSQNVSFKNYVKNVEGDEALINFINPKWSGALPATFVYDTAGVLRESHFGQNDFAGFQKIIEQVQESLTKN